MNEQELRAGYESAQEAKRNLANSIAEAALALGIAFSVLAPDDRVMLFGILAEHYCQHCGRELRNGEKCHCENDE